MSKPSEATPPSTTSATPIADQLGAIKTSLASIRSLTRKERKALAARSATVPDSLIEQMIEIAEKNGGVVAGMPLDVAAAKAALARVSEAAVVAAAGREIAHRAEDGAIQERIVVADRVFAIYRALGRLVKTPEGNALLDTHGEMATALRNRPRRPRKKKASSTLGTSAAAAHPTSILTTT